jgi:hypothetical protein
MSSIFHIEIDFDDENEEEIEDTKTDIRDPEEGATKARSCRLSSIDL